MLNTTPVPVNIPNLPESLLTLVAAMNANNAASVMKTYSGFEVSEARRKYFLLNAVLSNGQRSGLFLVDRTTLSVFQSTGYGKTNGRCLGTVESITSNYNEGTLSKTSATSAN